MSFSGRIDRVIGPILSDPNIQVSFRVLPDSSFYLLGGGGSVFMTAGFEINDTLDTYEVQNDYFIGSSASGSYTNAINNVNVGGITWNDTVPIENYMFRAFYVNPGTGVKVYGHYFNSHTQSLATPTPITVDDSVYMTTVPKKIRGVHGSLLMGDYIWGSARSTNEACLVKVNKDDYDDLTTFMMYYNPEETERLTVIEQIVSVGPCIFGKFPEGIFRFNTTDNTYKIYLTSLSTSEPLATDGEFLYVPISNTTYKYALTEFQDSDPQWNDIGYITAVDSYDAGTQGGYIDNPTGGYSTYDKGAVHSLCVDDTHIYLAYTSNAEWSESLQRSLSELHKVNKSTMNADGWTYIPKSTDDMTQTDDYLFLGTEPSSSYPQSYGYGWGAVNVEKADLQVNSIAQLSTFDTTGDVGYADAVSYASLIFGDYLIDMKTDRTFYVLDITAPEAWTLDKPAGEFTLGRFILPVTNVGQPLSGLIPNDLVLDAPNQIFHSFCFDKLSGGTGPSGLVKFEIPDFLFILTPTILTLPVGFDDDATQVELSATVTNGGGTLSAYGFRVGTSPGALTDEHPGTLVGDTLSYTLTGLTPGETYYYQVYAENEKGETTSETISFDAVTQDYGLTGIVSFEGTAEPGVRMYLIDPVTHEVVDTMVTDSDGEYTFTGLTPAKPYLIAGYKDLEVEKFRVLSKILTPSTI